jgi:hypothetical protein
MSRFGKHGYRCNYCGKFTTSRDGEYTRPDGSAGYMHDPVWAKGTELDTCEECSEKRCWVCGELGHKAAGCTDEEAKKRYEETWGQKP